MKKISKNRQSFLARKAMHIYKSTVLFLPILGYFCLFLPICESVANLHESTLLFVPNIHASSMPIFAYFSLFDLCVEDLVDNICRLSFYFIFVSLFLLFFIFFSFSF